MTYSQKNLYKYLHHSRSLKTFVQTFEFSLYKPKIKKSSWSNVHSEAPRNQMFPTYFIIKFNKIATVVFRRTGIRCCFRLRGRRGWWDGTHTSYLGTGTTAWWSAVGRGDYGGTRASAIWLTLYCKQRCLKSKTSKNYKYNRVITE